MKISLLQGSLIALFAIAEAVPVFSHPNRINIWPGLAPGTEARENKENWKDSTNVYDVYQPELTIFLAPQIKTITPAIIVCPGGGYTQLVIEKEGYKIARWLNDHGITAFVLKYRLNPTEAFRDAQRAVSVVRANADQYRIDPAKIGVIGFSAGANLIGTLAVYYAEKERHDAIDDISSRPDFWIGVYGVYEPRLQPTGTATAPAFSPLGQFVTKDTPPAFLVHAEDDDRVSAENSLNMYTALLRKKIPAELHIYEQGKHGFALETNRSPEITSTIDAWSTRCLEWLRVRDILTQ
jgi:acetyl esterase/lipase